MEIEFTNELIGGKRRRKIALSFVHSISLKGFYGIINLGFYERVDGFKQDFA